MSCILYSQASYKAMAANPLFRHICRERKQVPEQLAGLFFGLNINAFKTRYSHDESILKEIEGQTINPDVDYEFTENLTGRYTDLYALLNRIDYQLIDGNTDSPAYQEFDYFRDHIAREIADRYRKVEPVQLSNNSISLMDMIGK